MTRDEAERIIDEIWLRNGMTDNSGTDFVRAELVEALLRAFAAGKASK